MAIEEFAVEIPDAEADKISSCSQAIEYIAAHPCAKQVEIFESPPYFLLLECGKGKVHVTCGESYE